MEVLLSSGDVSGAQAAWREAKDRGTDEEHLAATVDRLLRTRAIEVGARGGDALLPAARTLFTTGLAMAAAGMCAKTTPISLMSDLMELGEVSKDKELFSVLEDNMEMLKAVRDAPLQNTVLRLCNDLLRRLSRCVETSFSGRIHVFLSRFMPAAEKSALNIAGHFNSSNTTVYQSMEEGHAALLADDEDVDGDRKNKDTALKVNPSLYSSFWKMQLFFSNPSLCFEKDQMKTLQKDAKEVLSALSAFKLEDRWNEGEEEDSATRKSAHSNHYSHYFAKHLTNPKLLHLQLNDASFRRSFLLQCLILFQYLQTDAKCKAKSHTLVEEDKQWVKDRRDKVVHILRETPPRGTAFATNVLAVLTREASWNEWKNGGCPDLLTNAAKEQLKEFKKRPRTKYDSEVVDLGNGDITKLWTGDGSQPILASCRDRKRKHAPVLATFIADPLLEMDPEQQIEEEYKSIRQSSFQWRTGRLLLAANALYPALSSSTVTTEMGPFLENAILEAAKTIPELKEEVRNALKSRDPKVVPPVDKVENETNTANGVKEEEGANESATGTYDEAMDAATCLSLSRELEGHADVMVEALELKALAIELLEGDKTKGDALEGVLLKWTAEGGTRTRLRSLLAQLGIHSAILNSS